MPIPLEFARLQDEQDAQRLSQLLSQSFVGDPEVELAYMSRIGWEQFRVVRQGDTPLGSLAIIPMGQWFGGQRVPMAGIAAVCIAPEARGGGVALELMQRTVQELHQNRVALSTLYPAVQRLYRRVGYEQGGTHCQWRVAPAEIAVAQPQLPIEPFTPTPAALAPLFQQQAQHHNGLLDRHNLIWHWITTPNKNERCYGYRFGSAPAPEGYLVFIQDHLDQGNRLKILDWATLTPQAVQSFWAFLASHRSQIKQVQWSGAALDWLSLGLPEQPAKQISVIRWLTRIIHVEAALTDRGYPQTLTGELHLDIRDDLLPANAGKWQLSWSAGQAHVSRGGRGDLSLDIRGLAPLYTGLFSPYQLRQMGYLEGSDPALSIAQQAFSGTAPWLADFF